jgi:hypothetical protein
LFAGINGRKIHTAGYSFKFGPFPQRPTIRPQPGKKCAVIQGKEYCGDEIPLL